MRLSVHDQDLPPHDQILIGQRRLVLGGFDALQGAVGRREAHHLGIAAQFDLRLLLIGNALIGAGLKALPGGVHGARAQAVDLHRVRVGKMAQGRARDHGDQGPLGAKTPGRKALHVVVGHVRGRGGPTRLLGHRRALHQPPRAQRQQAHEQHRAVHGQHPQKEMLHPKRQGGGRGGHA